VIGYINQLDIYKIVETAPKCPLSMTVGKFVIYKCSVLYVSRDLWHWYLRHVNSLCTWQLSRHQPETDRIYGTQIQHLVYVQSAYHPAMISKTQ